MRWSQVLETEARRLSSERLEALLVDPATTANGRRIIEAELASRVLQESA